MDKFLEWFKGYKTLVANATVGVAVLVAALFPDFGVPGVPQINEAVDSFGSAAIAVVAFVNIVLRLVTNTAPFRKE